MTTLYIDNKATAKKSIELYEIDRSVYPEIKDLMQLAYDAIDKDVYLVRVYIDDIELCTVRNPN